MIPTVWSSSVVAVGGAGGFPWILGVTTSVQGVKDRRKTSGEEWVMMGGGGGAVTL